MVRPCSRLISGSLRSTLEDTNLAQAGTYNDSGQVHAKHQGTAGADIVEKLIREVY